MNPRTDQELIEHDIEGFLQKHQEKELLRFVTVGSVDDGKSTLIGRLLHDTHGIYEDQLLSVKRASAKRGMEVDLSLFTDGLKAEREQGITIDVAYRYFSTENRKFIIADTPGHVQYTRNMATGASTANVAVILIDARYGVLPQSRRHAYIAAMLGIPHLAVCVNKMDLVDFDQVTYQKICAEFGDFSARLGFKDTTFFPISAKGGDNCVHPSDHTPWHRGGTFLQFLETVPIAEDRNHQDFRFPVQYVLRPHLNYRGYAAQLASGVVSKGDEVMVLPSKRRSHVLAIDTFEGEVPSAHPPQSVTIRLTDEIDISRGDMLVHPDNIPTIRKRFDAMVVWMNEKPLDPGKRYLLKHTTRMVRAEFEAIAYTVDLETLGEVAATKLDLNEIGRVTVSCHQPLYFDGYRRNRATGSFVVIDPITNNTVGAGMILDTETSQQAIEDAEPPLPRTEVSATERRERLGQGGAVVWLTGLPAAGKSALAYALERKLFDLGRVASVLDPDDQQSSAVHIEGEANHLLPEVARRLADAGLIAICASPAPRLSDRARAREAVGRDRFYEVHVATPLAVCRLRDTRGHYAATKEEPLYEAPKDPTVRISLEETKVDAAAERIAQALQAAKVFE